MISILSIQSNAKECQVNYRDHIVHYADEDHTQTPENHLITLNYDTMELLNIEDLQGSLNHHADPMGTLSKANYMLLVPKGSNYVTVRDIKSGNFVKKIRLPFNPRSSDAYNSKKNLVLLTASNRPAAVLIDPVSLKIVGKAGFNIECNQDKGIPLNIDDVYDTYNDFDPNIQCKPIDFGGSQISGHPIWISAKAFVIVDRANRLLHVYKIRKNGSRWDTKLVQTIQANTSVHQLIPEDANNPHNRIFYGMTESNIAQKQIAGIYKFELVNKTQLKQLSFTPLKIDNIKGLNGHNLYITPDKRFLYAPVGKRLIEKEAERTWVNGEWKWVRTPVKRWVWSRYQQRWILITQYTEGWQWQPGHWKITEATSEESPKGAIYVVDTDTMQVRTQIPAGKGAGHVAFSRQKGIAIVTNHNDDYVTAINYKTHTFIKNIPLGFDKAGIASLTQSHMQYVSKDGEYYYNFWSDGGVFFRINLSDLEVDASVEVGGIPIQGNFYEHVAVNCDLPEPAPEDGYDDIFIKNDIKIQEMKVEHKQEESDRDSKQNNDYSD